MDHAQDEKKNFFGKNNKSRSWAFRKFLFYQNIKCFDWVMNFFLSSVMFSVKKVSFPTKTPVSFPLKKKLRLPVANADDARLKNVPLPLISLES